MKKKIGIVTWYNRGPNYGSCLQAYASYYTLSKYGEVEILNYGQSYTKKTKFVISKMKRIIMFFVNHKYFKMICIFKKWINKNMITSKFFIDVNKVKNYSKKFDIMICGSDQIWNNDENCNDVFFLQIIDKNKRIAYAPSFGRNNWRNDLVEKYTRYINEIKYLSVREETGKQLIFKYTGRNAEVVLDPTLLLDMNDWESCFPSLKKRYVNEEYIFVYFVSPKKELYNSTIEFANRLGIKVIIPSPYNKFNCKINNFFNQEEWINGIKYAKYVITDSFHGTVFSMTFNKKFIVFKRGNDDSKISQNSRISDILTKVNLINHFTNNIDENVLYEEIDYSIINSLLFNERKKSFKFLDESIKSIEEGD